MIVSAAAFKPKQNQTTGLVPSLLILKQKLKVDNKKTLMFQLGAFPQLFLPGRIYSPKPPQHGGSRWPNTESKPVECDESFDSSVSLVK